MLGRRRSLRNGPIQYQPAATLQAPSLWPGEHGLAARRSDRSHAVRTTPEWMIHGRTPPERWIIVVDVQGGVDQVRLIPVPAEHRVLHQCRPGCTRRAAAHRMARIRGVALARVQAMLDSDVASLSPRLAMLVAGAAALLDDGKNDAFERALTVPDAARWPFALARVHLAYGERLRRDRATSDARRHPPRSARYLQPARRRAVGRTCQPRTARDRSASRPRPAPGSGHAYPAVARDRDAAAGLTNKQVGERLYLLHHTIATHLYQIFPKLGVTSGAALRDSLSGSEDREAADL